MLHNPISHNPITPLLPGPARKTSVTLLRRLALSVLAEGLAILLIVFLLLPNGSPTTKGRTYVLQQRPTTAPCLPTLAISDWSLGWFHPPTSTTSPPPRWAKGHDADDAG